MILRVGRHGEGGTGTKDIYVDGSLVQCKGDVRNQVWMN